MHSCFQCDLGSIPSEVSEILSQIAFLFLVFLLPATKLGQGYIFTGVCDSVPRGGLPQYMLGCHTPLPEQTPPEPGIPPAQSMLGGTVNAQAVCILLECNLVFVFGFFFGSRSQNWIIFKVKTCGVSVKYLFLEIFTISSVVLKTRPKGITF